ncbi:MAG: hypothetical protein J3R72DRAFT_499071 [Linnemannia gamsii]|nr:MAG: hypothetical protein J3R72DRAFT_499071 [Linnemannia gamsii]
MRIHVYYSYYFGRGYRDAFSHSFCFIPPIEEFNQYYGLKDNATINSTPPSPAITRPTWMWDWHLPALVLLKLASEFTFLFEFRMLDYCPALQSLELEMRTATGSHSRTITTADMFTPTASTICVSSLTKLRLHGPWHFGSMHCGMSFLNSMFPRLESLSALGWTSKAFTDILEMARTFPLKELCLDSDSSAKS